MNCSNSRSGDDDDSRATLFRSILPQINASCISLICRNIEPTKNQRHTQIENISTSQLYGNLFGAIDESIQILLVAPAWNNKPSRKKAS